MVAYGSGFNLDVSMLINYNAPVRKAADPAEEKRVQDLLNQR